MTETPSAKSGERSWNVFSYKSRKMPRKRN